MAASVKYSALIGRSGLCGSNLCPAATSSQITIPYGNGGVKLSARASHSEERSEEEDMKSKSKRSASVITDEKARWLRRELRSTKINKVGMYHSVIASQLAISDHHN